MLHKNYTQLKYIVGTRYILYRGGLRKSSNSNHVLSEIWREGMRVKINETM